MGYLYSFKGPPHKTLSNYKRKTSDFTVHCREQVVKVNTIRKESPGRAT